MFAEADKNKNGKIDFDEFVDMMLPSIQAEVNILTANLLLCSFKIIAIKNFQKNFN